MSHINTLRETHHTAAIASLKKLSQDINKGNIGTKNTRRVCAPIRCFRKARPTFCMLDVIIPVASATKVHASKEQKGEVGRDSYFTTEQKTLLKESLFTDNDEHAKYQLLKTNKTEKSHRWFKPLYASAKSTCDKNNSRSIKKQDADKCIQYLFQDIAEHIEGSETTKALQTYWHALVNLCMRSSNFSLSHALIAFMRTLDRFDTGDIIQDISRDQLLKKVVTRIEAEDIFAEHLQPLRSDTAPEEFKQERIDSGQHRIQQTIAELDSDQAFKEDLLQILERLYSVLPDHSVTSQNIKALTQSRYLRFKAICLTLFKKYMRIEASQNLKTEDIMEIRDQYPLVPPSNNKLSITISDIYTRLKGISDTQQVEALKKDLEYAIQHIKTALKH